MYFGIIIASMLVLPLASLALELALVGGAPLLLAAKWFVFWGVGVRVGLAAVRQMAQPEFTAGMLNIVDPRAAIVVRELGFANAAIALISLLALLVPSFVVPAALAGALFLGLAGIQHARVRERSGKETIAMVSDLAMSGTLAVLLLARLA